jgi:hypothetical protein
MIRRRTAAATATGLLLAALWAPGGAAAQDAVDPHVWTCGDLLQAQSPDDMMRGNMMLTWAMGYMYGRFGAIETANMTAERYQQNVSELVAVFQQICPNIPDMTIAEFTRNLADDFAATVQGEGQ